MTNKLTQLMGDYIAEITGSCPMDTFNSPTAASICDSDKCDNSYSNCWVKYFEHLVIKRMMEENKNEAPPPALSLNAHKGLIGGCLETR